MSKKMFLMFLFENLMEILCKYHLKILSEDISHDIGLWGLWGKEQ